MAAAVFASVLVAQPATASATAANRTARVITSHARQAPPATAPVPLPPPPPPKTWILVDADTGAVLDGRDAHTPVLVASIFKVLTAVVVEENLAPASDVPISARAEGMPARKINVKQGQVWNSDDLMHALLLASANDAAVALAERTGGTLEQFGTMMDRTAQRIGMTDPDVLHDPAGLDDEFSVDGGNLISARDMAIATRVFLSYPQLAEIVAEPIYRFHGPDGNDHHVVNHNLFIKTYPGAIGVKTGYTRRAGHSLIAAARRDGRTMVAVVAGAADPDRSAAGLLDKGFATAVADEAPGLERLPDVSQGNATDPVTKAPPPPRPVTTPTRADLAGSPSSYRRALKLLALGGLPAVVILALRTRARLRIRRRRRDRPAPPPRPDHPVGTPAYQQWRRHHEKVDAGHH